MRNYGSGTIYQRKDGKKLWVAQMVLNNNRYSESFQSREEAEDWLKSISFFLNNADDGNNPISFSSYIDVWLKSLDPNLDLENGSPEAVLRTQLLDEGREGVRPNTFVNYRTVLRKHVLPKIPQNKLLPAVTRANIKEIFKEARLAKVGDRTRQSMRNILHKAFEDAVVLGLIQANPVVGIKVAYTPEERDNLTISKSKELIRVSKRTRYKNLIKIGLVTGLRMGKLIGLRWDDVDFETKCIYVREQVQRQEKKDEPSSLEFTLLKTKASKRTIALGRDSIKVLRDQKELLELERALAKDKWNEFGLVFPSTVGTPIEQTTLRNAFNRFLKKAGLDESIHFHDLRHASISAIRSKKVNADVATAMKRSGHSQTETLDRYTHDFADEEDYIVAEKLDELILGDTDDN